MLSTGRELMVFLWVRRKFWMIPLVIMMLLIGATQIATHGSAIGPFIYALF